MFSMTCSAGAGQGQTRFFAFVVVVVTFVGLFVHLYFAMLRYNCKWFYSPVIDFLPVLNASGRTLNSSMELSLGMSHPQCRLLF